MTTNSRTWKNEMKEGSLFEVSTELLTEREIDVHDRGAHVRFTLNYLPQEKRNIVLEDVEVLLYFPDSSNTAAGAILAGEKLLDYDNIGIAVYDSNALNQTYYTSLNKMMTVYKAPSGKRLLEGGQIEVELVVHTGVFTDPLLKAQAATAGLKKFQIKINYRAVDLKQKQGDATTVDWYFEVARD